MFVVPDTLGLLATAGEHFFGRAMIDAVHLFISESRSVTALTA
jgi:hypothetical protein